LKPASAQSPSFDEFVRGYEPTAIAVAIAGTALLTGAGQLATRFADGSFQHDANLGFGVCWGLALATIPLLLQTRRVLLSSPRPQVPAIYWAQSMVQLAWLALLAWYVTPFYLPVLFFVLCLLLFNDTRFFFNGGMLKIAYAGMWGLQLLLLLLLDLTTGTGLLFGLKHDFGRSSVMLIAEVCIAALSVMLIEVVGKSLLDRDAAARRNAELESSLRSMKTERGVMARSCDFLLQGLTAGRFSHDVASPISVLSVEVERLRTLLQAQGSTPLDEKLGRCLGRIEAAAEHTHALTRSLARSLREPGDPITLDLSELVHEAGNHAANILKRRGVTMIPQQTKLDASRVVVSRDHAAAVGTILVNCALKRPDAAVHVEGASTSDYFCRLLIRDFGVTAQERQEALLRVEAHMSLLSAESPTMRLAEYDGYGIGLLLTKALVVRWGGWMAASAPADGDGLVFSLVLPKVPPQQIPDELNTPEKVVLAELSLA
jgi:signal transduction histidine kinase